LLAHPSKKKMVRSEREVTKRRVPEREIAGEIVTGVEAKNSREQRMAVQSLLKL
jgi:hypothetical protein